MVLVQSVSAGHGATWFRQGWQAFRNAPGLLIGVLLLWLILAVAFEFIPLIGPLAFVVISPALFGGYVLMCRHALADGQPALEQFFAGLTQPDHRGEAIILGLLLLVAYVVVFVLSGLFFMLTAVLVLGSVPWQTLGELQSATPQDAVMTLGMLIVFLLTTLLGVLLFTLLAMAFTYASPLVLEGRASATAALRLSLDACLRNILPLSVFAVIYIVLFIIALIPLGLGLFLFLPVSLAAVAASYGDLFAEDESMP